MYVQGFGGEAEEIFICRRVMLRRVLKKSFGRTWTGIM